MSSFLVSKSDSPEDIQAAQEARQRFFAAIGYAITRWSYVNAALFEYCAYALNADRSTTAIIYYRSRELGQRLQLVDLLMNRVLSGPARGAWGKIQEKANGLLPFRNHLAHDTPTQVISTTVIMGATPEEQPPSEHFWIIAADDTKRLYKQGGLRSKEAEIGQHIVGINELLGLMESHFKALPPR